jgi:hypothetical protein
MDARLGLVVIGRSDLCAAAQDESDAATMLVLDHPAPFNLWLRGHNRVYDADLFSNLCQVKHYERSARRDYESL